MTGTRATTPATGDVAGLTRELIQPPRPNPRGDERTVAGYLTELATASALPTRRAPRGWGSRPSPSVVTGGGRVSLLGTLSGVALLALVGSSPTLRQFPATASDPIRGLVILAVAALFVSRTFRD